MFGRASGDADDFLTKDRTGKDYSDRVGPGIEFSKSYEERENALGRFLERVWR